MTRDRRADSAAVVRGPLPLTAGAGRVVVAAADRSAGADLGPPPPGAPDVGDWTAGPAGGSAALSTILERETRLAGVAELAGVSADELLGLLEASVADADQAFTEAESRALSDAGIDLSGPVGDPTGAMTAVSGLRAVAAMWADARTVEQAAAELGVSPARIRQRISDGQMASVRRPGGYLLPAWQFIDATVVPHLADILPAAAGVHPLGLSRFMTRPDVDLSIDDVAVSPVVWLASGGDPGPVAALVAALAVAA